MKKTTFLFFFLLLFSAKAFSSFVATKDQDRKTVIMILCMHRSGSSLIAKGLQTMGLDLGSNLLPAAADNPYGFFEDIDIGRFNETILYLLDLAADSIGNFPKAIQKESILVEYGTTLIKKKLEEKPSFGFKDPRTARTMKIWREIAEKLPDVTFKAVVIVRNPLSVAESLYHRNKIDHVKSFYLWLQYYISAILHTNDMERYFISYENMMTNPTGELKSLAKKLNVKIAKDSDKALQKFSQDFINQSLQHYVHSIEDLHQLESKPLYMSSIYQLLYNLSTHDSMYNDNQDKLKEVCLRAAAYNTQIGSLLQLIDKTDKVGVSADSRLFSILKDLAAQWKEADRKLE